MLFTDPEFLFFFLPTVLLLHLLLPVRCRNYWLLIASLAFYAAGEGLYLGVLLVSIVYNHAIGLAIDRSDSHLRRKVLLWIAVVGNLLMLIRFKYLAFIIENATLLLPFAHLTPPHPDSLHLPVGISFFTFQAVSYVIDVYRRDIPAVRSLSDFAMYISLFPQLIAGPIVRMKDILSRLHDRCISSDDFAKGASRFVTGLAKKLLIADTMARAADAAFDAGRSELTTGLAWLGLIGYSLQIYYDFSGYSDMAIGIGHMLGFRFMENFRYPYAAASITEFWRRWHISLSTWFRDYLYIPLGGSRASPVRVSLNLLLVFLLCGLWHGASWTFVAWGAWHGCFLTIERAGLLAWLGRRGRLLRHAYALAIVMLGWVLFRAPSLSAAAGFASALAGNGAAETAVGVHFGLDFALVLGAGLLFSWPVSRIFLAYWGRIVRNMSGTRGDRLYFAGRLTGVMTMGINLFLCLLQVAYGTHNPFIYFRF